VRELNAEGMNDQQIKDYLVARYGDFVLFDPPVKKPPCCSGMAHLVYC